MLTFEQIKELIEQVARHGLHGIEVDRSGFRLRIEGQRSEAVAVPPSAAAAMPMAAEPAPAAEPAAAAATATEPKAADDSLHVLKSPIVGTFYRRPNPDTDPFVEPGQRVDRGQVVCIIEAMKLMNEIESDVAGVVVKVLPKNAQAVEFGEPLFAIQPE